MSYKIIKKRLLAFTPHAASAWKPLNMPPSRPVQHHGRRRSSRGQLLAAARASLESSGLPHEPEPVQGQGRLQQQSQAQAGSACTKSRILGTLEDDALWNALAARSPQALAASFAFVDEYFVRVLEYLMEAGARSPAPKGGSLQLFLCLEDDISLACGCVFDGKGPATRSSCSATSTPTKAAGSKRAGSGNSSGPSSDFHHSSSSPMLVEVMNRAEGEGPEGVAQRAASAASFLTDNALLMSDGAGLTDASSSICMGSTALRDLPALRQALRDVLLYQLWMLPTKLTSPEIVNNLMASPALAASSVIAAGTVTEVCTVCVASMAAIIAWRLCSAIRDHAAAMDGDPHHSAFNVPPMVRCLHVYATEEQAHHTQHKSSSPAGWSPLGSGDMAGLWEGLSEAERLNLLREMGDIAERLGSAGRAAYQMCIVGLVHAVSALDSRSGPEKDPVAFRQLLATEKSVGGLLLERMGLALISSWQAFGSPSVDFAARARKCLAERWAQVNADALLRELEKESEEVSFRRRSRNGRSRRRKERDASSSSAATSACPSPLILEELKLPDEERDQEDEEEENEQNEDASQKGQAASQPDISPPPQGPDAVPEDGWERVDYARRKPRKHSPPDDKESLLLMHNVMDESSDEEPERVESVTVNEIKLAGEVEEMASALQRLASLRRPYIMGALFGLKAVVRRMWPSAIADVYGSVSTGLAVPASDLDVVVVGVPDSVQWFGISAALNGLASELRRCSWVSTVKVIERTAVPILKVDCAAVPSGPGDSDSRSIIKMDVSLDWLNAHRGLATSAFVQRQQAIHPQLTSLLIVLKQLLLEKGLSDPYKGGLSSYALTIMITALLQQYALLPPAARPNTGHLLLEFLQTYGTGFDTRRHGVLASSAASAGPLAPLNPQNFGGVPRVGTPEWWAPADPVVIQDPLDAVNNVGRTCFGFRQVQLVFDQALRAMEAMGGELAEQERSLLGAMFGTVHHRHVVNLTAQVWCPQQPSQQHQSPPEPSVRQSMQDACQTLMSGMSEQQLRLLVTAAEDILGRADTYESR